MTEDAAAAVETDRPSPARVYDYSLGGSHNFAVDRQAQEAARVVFPQGERLARDNRAFLHRVVRYCLDRGIRQFLDLGSGVPTVGNVHEIAQRLAPEARVVYVDHEPIAARTAQNMLAGNAGAAMVESDVRDHDRVLSHPDSRRLLDFRQPVAVLAVGILYYLPEDPAPLLAAYRRHLVPGSVLAISHMTDDIDTEAIRRAADTTRNWTDPIVLRGHAEVVGWFSGLELVEPGVVSVSQWRAERAAEELAACYGGLGVVPE